MGNWSWEVISIAVFGLALLFLFLGIPVALALGIVGMLSALFFLGKMGIVAYAAWQTCNSFVLSAIPLFIFMGHIFVNGGLSSSLYDGAAGLVGRFRGGLLHANIAACAIFAAISGSSVATAATIGSMAVPELEKRGYDMKMTLGSVAAGGTLGILIPPSNCLIIYAVICEVSIGSLFIAGIIPGIILALLFMIYIWIMAKMRPQIAPLPVPIPPKQRLVSIVNMWPTFILLTVVLGGIYLGIMTPTESAAVGAVIALVFSLINKKLTRPILDKSLTDAMKATSSLLFIMIGASIIGGTLGLLRVPNEMSEWVVSLPVSRFVILSIIYILYLILGCLIDTVSMLVLTLPVIFPIVLKLGYDPIWFGIVITVLVEAAMISPPVGFNVFTIHSLFPHRPMSEVFVGSMPFFVIMILFIFILTAFPELVTWLPSTMAR